MSTFQPIRPASNKVSTVPAPTGGLNARDSLANMPETDALVLVNFWPQPYGCQVRPGYEEWVTGLPGTPGTLATWADVTGTSKLFAWAGTDATDYGIYDVSTKMAPGDPPLVPVVTGLSNARWETIQTVNDGGANLIAVNAVDAALIYNATGVHTVLYDAVPMPPVPVAYTWYGLDSSTVAQLTSHQGRLWATVKDSAVGWYLGVDQLYGQWAPFDFGALFSAGGSIAFMATWTIDDGNGAEDHLIIMSTRGQVAVYGGSDPSTISTWELVGLYFIGEPVKGRRGYYKVGGDMLLLTQRGLVSMTGLLVSTKVNEASTGLRSEKVQLLISALVSEVNDLVDWELYLNASNNLFLINIPSSVLGGNRQLACNVVTDASPWAFFADVDASTWATFNNEPFFADYQGRIHKFWVGNVDEVNLAGTSSRAIKSQVQQAYSYMGNPAMQKQVGMYRPNFIVGGNLTYNSKIEYDFSVRPVAAPSDIYQVPYGGVWDTSKWDESRWGGGVFADRQWIQAIGIGSAASLRMTSVSEQEVMWVSTDYSYKVGTVL